MKRQNRFNHFILFTTTALLLGSCGPQRNKEDAAFSTSAIMSPARNLTTAERTIATRICYAYQSKNSAFRTQSYYGGTFKFDMEKKECAGTNKVYTISGVLATSQDNALIYQTDSTAEFSSKVQTSQKGFLSQLCSKIQTNQAISNTATDSGTTVQVVFSVTDMDQYTFDYFTKQNDVMKISMSETFKVRTQFNSGSGQILGMDEIYTKQNVCTDDTSKYSELTQKFGSFTIK